jgi:pimeloyl-ACP methyl ester carboxylesterase
MGGMIAAEMAAVAPNARSPSGAISRSPSDGSWNSGPPLVFLHGAGGLVEESPFLAALARRWHVFAPLLPGYGDSEGGDTLPDMVRQFHFLPAETMAGSPL